ncbi:MAG TPA: transposase [Bacteroidales bacterium]|nr:transposase [Bacteroidales bacterium]HOK74791.1 transposase [Bacteroidales bacterium]HOM41694.1 transposase [Bacteroidales bacterium]HPP93486.1 transposase [Bacteroidales bacterium]HQK70730.1 transposase [Bacteroidales bacterium]
MLMVKQIHKRTAQEKERIILDIQSLGVIAGCRKWGISKTLYYYWVNKYQASGIEGLEDRRGKNMDAHIKRLEKENRILKELLAEKELESKLKDELLKKKFGLPGKKEK